MSHEYHISVVSAVSCNRGRSWNVLSADTGVRLYIFIVHFDSLVCSSSS